MPPRKGQKHRFPLNTFTAVKRNQEVQLACALAKDKQYAAKAKKLKQLEAKAISSIKFSLLFVVRYWNMVMRSLILITDELIVFYFHLDCPLSNLCKSS